MLGTKSGFHVCVTKRAPKVKGIHCMIHCQTLASKTVPLEKVLDQIIHIVYFVKVGPVNS